MRCIPEPFLSQDICSISLINQRPIEEFFTELKDFIVLKLSEATLKMILVKDLIAFSDGELL
jgi:hypothetical protein